MGGEAFGFFATALVRHYQNGYRRSGAAGAAAAAAGAAGTAGLVADGAISYDIQGSSGGHLGDRT